MVMPYHLHMPSYFLETFTEYPFSDKYIKLVMLPVDSLHHSPMHCRHSSFHINGLPKFGESQDNCQGLSYYIRL